MLAGGFCAAAAAEYRPEAWNLQAREKFAEQRYGVFIVWGLYAYYAQGECYMLQRKIDRDACARRSVRAAGQRHVLRLRNIRR